MTHVPIEPDVRARLRREQAAEASALKVVQRAQDGRRRQQRRVDEAQAKIGEAMVELVRVSGVQRAARLTGEPARVVRQMVRDADQPGDEAR